MLDGFKNFHNFDDQESVCSQAGCKVGDEGLVQRRLHLLLDLLDDDGLVVLQLRYALKLLLHRLQVLLHLTLEVAHASSILIQVGRHGDHLELGEAVQSSLDCHLEARLERGDQVLVVHVDDSEVNAFNQSFLFDYHVTLDDTIECHQDNHIGVQDVTTQVVQELDHAEGGALDRRDLVSQHFAV